MFIYKLLCLFLEVPPDNQTTEDNFYSVKDNKNNRNNNDMMIMKMMKMMNKNKILNEATPSPRVAKNHALTKWFI